VSENERMCLCASVFVFVFACAVGSKTKALRCARIKSLCILSRERGSSEGEKRKEKTTFREQKLCSEKTMFRKRKLCSDNDENYARVVRRERRCGETIL
jgi:hypothetical protein